jgi:prophage regulatory protein
MTDRNLRKKDLEPITGFTFRHLHDMEARGDFPRRYRPDPKSKIVVWSEREVQQWIEDRKASREAI